MIEGVRLRRDELQQRYGLSSRDATRVQTLLKRGVTLTSAVLERFGRDAEVSKFLRSRRILQASEDENKLSELATKAGLGLTRTGDGMLLIATSEELIREEVALVELRPGRLIEADELRRVVGKEQLTRLKLIILTSADEKEKITAIRQLALLAGDFRDKGGVLITALSDRSAEVRAEAAQALVSLGLSRDVAECARLLAEGSEKQKEASADRLSTLIEGAGEKEIAVILSVAMGTLRNERYPTIRTRLLRAVKPACRRLSDGPASELLRFIFAEVQDEEPSVLSAVGDVLRELSQALPSLVSRSIIEELPKVGSASLRRFLLGLLDYTEIEESLRARVVELAIREVLNSCEPATQCIRIGNLLANLYEKSVPGLLEGFARGSRLQKIFICQVLDAICHRRQCSGRTKTEVLRHLADALKTAPWTVRVAILEMGLLGDDEIDASVRAEVAKELLFMLHEFNNPTIIERIEAVLSKMGLPAYEPAMEVVKKGVRKRERISAVRVVGRLVARFTDPRVEALRAEEAVAEFLRLLEADFPDKDVLASSLGTVCQSRVVSPTSIQMVMESLRGRLGKTSYPYGILQGLARIGFAPNASLEMRVDVAGLFIELLEEKLPEFETEKSPRGMERTFALGAGVTAYTEMVPTLLEGLKDICLRAESQVLRSKITEFLLKKWDVSETVVQSWGPGNRRLLLEMLGEVASRAMLDDELRGEVFRALMRKKEFMPALVTLGKIVESNPNSELIAELASELAYYILSEALERSVIPQRDMEVYAEVLGKVACMANIDEELREKVVRVLFDALREGSQSALEALRRIGESESVPEQLRQEVRHRTQSPNLPVPSSEF